MRRAFLHACGAVCDAGVRCQSACAVHRPNGTRARNAPSRIAPAPLRNRQIAFGSGRFPVRCISHRCVPLRGRWAARLARARFAAVRRLAPPPRNRLSSRARHPSANAACMARSRCLPSPCNAASRCLPRTGGGLRSGPARRRPSPCALSAHVRFCGARPAHLTVSKVSAYLRNLAQLWTPHETVVKQVFRRVPKTLAERAAHE